MRATQALLIAAMCAVAASACVCSDMAIRTAPRTGLTVHVVGDGGVAFRMLDGQRICFVAEDAGYGCYYRARSESYGFMIGANNIEPDAGYHIGCGTGARPRVVSDGDAGLFISCRAEWM